ncbi:50S ribosomal protein L37ae [Candidatus Micrarchaeota archaeon]|nr:50S ribosomal protein L37ae [Candidatus Micrarchaeota archaeon]
MRTPKYGRRIRKLAEAAIEQKRASYECPKCGKKKVRRKSFSLWECRSCGTRFAGGAYTFSTGAGVTSLRLIKEYSKE